MANKNLTIFPLSQKNADRFFLLMSIGSLESYIKGYINTDQLHSFIFEPAALNTAKSIGASENVIQFISDNFYFEDFINSPNGGKEYVINMANNSLKKAYLLLEELNNEFTDKELWNWFVNPSK